MTSSLSLVFRIAMSLINCGTLRVDTNEYCMFVDNPQPPTEFQNVDELATETSVTLSWKPGFDGGVEQIFLLDYRKFDSNTDWSTVTILDTGKQVINATLTFLASDSVYEFKLMATNDIGNSTTVGPLSVKTKGMCNCYMYLHFVQLYMTLSKRRVAEYCVICGSTKTRR